MQGKDIPSQTIIEERKKAYGLIKFEGKNHILTGEKLKNVLHPLLTRSVEQTVSGLVAHPGKVQGKVKIILTPMDIIKVEKGDIIISPETTPDFLPAIHTSVAIVTDQGGIISHAAIVAREFKKPCIVGTKYATQIFKDPYLFDFVGTADFRREREMEQALVDNIQRFLLELGVGFAFVDKDFYLDLVFYHLKLRCFVVVDGRQRSLKSCRKS